MGKAFTQAYQELVDTTDEVNDVLLNGNSPESDSMSTESPNSPSVFRQSLLKDMAPIRLNKPLPLLPMEELAESGLEPPTHDISTEDDIEPKALLYNDVSRKFCLNSAESSLEVPMYGTSEAGINEPRALRSSSMPHKFALMFPQFGLEMPICGTSEAVIPGTRVLRSSSMPYKLAHSSSDFGLQMPVCGTSEAENTEATVFSTPHRYARNSAKFGPKHGTARADTVRRKTVITSPVPLELLLSPRLPVDTQPVQENKRSMACTTTADAADPYKKLSLLMREPTTEIFCHVKTMDPRKLDVLQGRLAYFSKAKEVYIRAKQGLTSRHDSNGKHRRNESETHYTSSNLDMIAGPEYMTDADLDCERLNRRIAEGANLSNPKIRSLTGDGKIPRKPLLAYDSMNPPPQRYRSTSLEDPFSDENDGKTDISSPEVDECELDGNSPGPKATKARPASAVESLFLGAQPEQTTSSQSRKEAQRNNKFSEFTSGLAQHPDTDFFATLPSGYSMPRWHLQAKTDASGRKSLERVPASSPSVLDFGFEDHSGEEGSGLANSSVHSERVTVEESKKEEGRLAAGIAQPSTPVARTNGPLAAKDNNKAGYKPKIPRASGKGLKIFDTCKRMVSMPMGVMGMKGMSTVFHGQRSKFPITVEPSKRRASTPGRLSQVSNDSTSLEELQME